LAPAGESGEVAVPAAAGQEEVFLLELRIDRPRDVDAEVHVVVDIQVSAVVGGRAGRSGEAERVAQRLAGLQATSIEDACLLGPGRRVPPAVRLPEVLHDDAVALDVLVHLHVDGAGHFLATAVLPLGPVEDDP